MDFTFYRSYRFVYGVTIFKYTKDIIIYTYKGVIYMTNLNEWFEIGISKEKYMEALEKHRSSFVHIYNHFQIPEEDIETLKQHEEVRALVLAEVWCGHCMLNIPVFLQLAETANIPVRFFPRDEHLELMDQYLTNEKRIIPIIIFIDKDGNELATWGPMAPEVEVFNEKLKQSLPDKGDPTYDEAFKQVIHVIGEAFTKDDTYWNYAYQDMKKRLTSI